MAERSQTIDLSHISVIIPMSETEPIPTSLIQALQATKIEIIFSRADTRAKALNAGARKSTREYLWFLHADSQIDYFGLNWLSQKLQIFSQSLNFFKLSFLRDGPILTKLNSIGANLRARMFGVPFGDQGFCMHRHLYEKIGGFPEDVQYGEDHVFVWRARQNGIRLYEIPAIIKTSARRYRQNGWLKTTWRYQCLWIKQAWPEFLILMKTR